MIAASKNGDDECPQVPQPKAAASPLVATAADVQLVQHALHERWPISRRKRKRIVNELYRLVEGAEDETTRVAASNALKGMDALNITEKKSPSQHVHFHGANAGQQASPVAFDPDYAEFLRTRAIAGDLHPGAVCPNGKPGQVAASSPPSGNGSGHNGNGNGNGKH